MISTKAHGALDYIMGFVLIIAPFILGFATGGAEMWLPIIVGVGTILNSTFTAYELGVSMKLSMRTHLWLDRVGGLILALSPWIFGFSYIVYLPHLILGIGVILAAGMTNPEPKEVPLRVEADK